MKNNLRYPTEKTKLFKKSLLWRSFLLSAASLWLSSCSLTTEPEETSENTIIVDHEQEEFAYTTITVSLEDVTRTANVRCIYKKQEEESEITISTLGKTLEEVYVEKSDYVVQGQLLAMLSGGNREDEIRELEYKIERNKLLLSYTELDEEYDRSYRWWTYLFRTSMSKQDTEQLEQELEAIGQRYRYLREDYQDSIDMDTAEIAHIKEEEEQCRIYANKTGEITYFNSDLLGRVITEEKSFVKIADRSQFLFESTQTSYAHCFQEGQPVELIISPNRNPVYLEVTPINMKQWDDKMFFKITSGDSNAVSLGATGIMSLVVDTRTQVLAVPNNCVHNTQNDQYYVYVLNNDVREIKFVEPGLRGDTLTEIIDGLVEGEEILLQ